MVSAPKATVFARIPFKYNKRQLERGEIITLQGTPRDGQLVGLNYLIVYNDKEYRNLPCDSCGKHFATDAFYHEHKMKRGGCLAEPSPITKVESAMLMDVDPQDVVVEE